MNLSKSEKIIFSILGVIGIGIVCNKVIYPGFLALKEGQSQNIAKDFVQEDFVLSLQKIFKRMNLMILMYQLILSRQIYHLRILENMILML